MKKVKILITVVCFFDVAFGQVKFAYNKDFEIVKAPTDFRYWRSDTRSGKYTFHMETKLIRSGKSSLHVHSDTAFRDPADLDVGYFMGRMPKKIFSGFKEVEIAGWIKTADHLSRAGIFLDFYSLKLRRSLSQHTIIADTINDNRGWQRVHAKLAIGPDVDEIDFGGILNGKGDAWFDDFSITLDGIQVMDTAENYKLPSAAEKIWLKKNAVALHGVNSTHENSDLDSLARWMGDAKIIAVGEPTHGTHEVMAVRLRIFQYLVEKKGFNTFMIEDNLPQAGLINDYVINGKDTAINLIKKYLFRVARNEEMLSIVQWMRSYNLHHENKLIFRGMDMQSTTVALSMLTGFAKRFDTVLHNLMNTMEAISLNARTNLDKSKRKLINDSLITFSRIVKEHIVSNQSYYLTRVPIDSLNWINSNATVLVQYSLSTSAHTRDSCMAVNVMDYIKQYPNAKILLSAHNGHIDKTPGDTGGLLEQYFNTDYFPVGFLTAEGNYTAAADGPDPSQLEYKSFQLEKCYPGSVEYYLQSIVLPNYMLSLTMDKNNLASKWLNSQQDVHGMGSVYIEGELGSIILRKSYKAVIFVKRTTHSLSYMLK